MVVCKCRKATRIYCFVHKVPVCGECICSPEHQICVVNKYSDWVINGDYDWPPKCASCNSELEAGSEDTTRLGCLHVIHTKCLISYVQSFPPQTAPAGYVCPTCSNALWPPTSIKDTGSQLHAKLKEAISQTGLEKNVFGNHIVTMPKPDMRGPPPAFASGPLVEREDGVANSLDNNFPPSSSLVTERYGIISSDEPEIVEVDGPNKGFMPEQESNYMKSVSPLGPSAMARKVPNQVERQTSEISYYADDEDVNSKKYVKRGSFRHKFLRMLLPFWSTSLPTLPVTAPPRKDSATDAPDGRARHQRSSRMDPRKILLFIAIMACMATMAILYYRLAQRNFGEEFGEEEPR
ncbi:Zinc finger protein-like 1 [Carex littledalei]|uniref:Zinc finger protein-like 1 n=1 Tax=Carex littledalei TaxID=544730 RepID=A0A833QWI6_9POAL|nr:Zinc finger protein-like 1 [Carex littledalei]